MSYHREIELSPGLEAGQPVSAFAYLEPASGLRGGDAFTPTQKLPLWITPNICRMLGDGIALKMLFAEHLPSMFPVPEASR